MKNFTAFNNKKFINTTLKAQLSKNISRNLSNMMHPSILKRIRLFLSGKQMPKDMNLP